MPRIDPERLLKCLQPLLEPTSGAIKSSEDVDKILGLMSKFSKKLVSKCIYVNILRSSHPTVLDLFMQRGGWNLVYGWANEGSTSKNYPLLREIIALLLQTPTTVPRLKENKFPVLIKALSKDCEDEDTKNLAKQVVARWISIAKGEEPKTELQPPQRQPQAEIPVQIANVRIPVDQNAVSSSDQPAVQELGNLSMNADSLLNIDPSIMPDAENQLMDFDLPDSHADIPLPDIDFNLDILSKVVDQQQLDQHLMPAPTLIVDPADGKHLPTSDVLAATPNSTTVSVACSHPPVKEDVMEMIQVQTAPKIFIKTVGGQRTVVQSIGSLASNAPEGHYCLVMKDGKNYLMKLKTEQKSIHSIVVDSANPAESKSQDAVDSKSKVKSPRKDPSVSPVIKVSGEPSLRTYSTKNKTSSVSKDSSLANKKSSDQNIKPTDKPESKDKLKNLSLKEKAGSTDGHKKPKSSSSSSKAAAAAAAKQYAEEEKLREEIRKQKALMKKRAKEAVKQKQQEKDQETLKKLNLTPATTSPSSSMKIPKIPKKSSSFADAIGIPGSDGSASVDKIKKVADEKEKSHTNKSEDAPIPSSPTKKFYGKKEESENSEAEKPKERRHKVKVFVSSKSRSDDLLKDMTETGKSKDKKDKEKEKEKEKEETKPSVTLGNSIPAVPPKISKRLSTDSIEKPGDAKKIKLADKSEKTKESKDSNKEKDKEKKKQAATISLKESSLFMDMLNASSENPKTSKRKRRLSTGNEKDKNEPVSPVEKSQKLQGKEETESPGAVAPDASGPATEEAPKPVFNFYRDTLNDEEEETDPKVAAESASKENMEKSQEDEDDAAFTPQEGDGKLKSALCLLRPRNKPKKSVRWREEEELREFHFFEMDETERINVTKQKPSDGQSFMELSNHEKAIERSFIRRKVNEEDEERNEWRLRKIQFNSDVIQPPCTSQEKFIQEEREKNVLGLFLPPGSILPETAIEPDTTIPVDRIEPRLIPVEDVNSITKVCDYRTDSWPAPKGHGNMMGFGALPAEIEEMPQNPTMNTFTPATDYNPWNASINFSVPPPVAVPNMGGMSAFQQFPPPPAVGMNLLGSAPPPVMGFPNPFAFPPTMVPPVNGPPPNGMDTFGGNGHNRDGRMGNRGGGGRFNNDTDQRRNFHGRDRDGGRDRGNNRDRDYRDDRGGRDRDRDRDYRRRDRDNNERDYRHHDRDRNNRDSRQNNNRNIRKDIPCRYFKKGFCSNGSRCEFSHDASISHDENRSNAYPRQDTHDSGRSRRSPDSSSRDIDLRQSSSDMDSNIDSWSSEKPASVGESDATSFEVPPSSPTEPEMPAFPPGAESTKVIPV